MAEEQLPKETNLTNTIMRLIQTHSILVVVQVFQPLPYQSDQVTAYIYACVILYGVSRCFV